MVRGLVVWPAKPGEDSRPAKAKVEERDHGSRSTTGRIHSTRRGSDTVGSRTNADGVDSHLYVLDRLRFHDLSVLPVSIHQRADSSRAADQSRGLRGADDPRGADGPGAGLDSASQRDEGATGKLWR